MAYRYFHLRDLAWQLLLDCGINSLPIDLGIILKHLNVQTMPYAFSDNVRGAFALLPNGKKVILYSQESNEQQARFTIAHEIGHIMLKHANIIEDIEKEANSFAARILMPLGVLKAIGVSKAEDIAHICNVSLESAKFRTKRIENIAPRQKYNTSLLERKVIEQFNCFITSYKQ